MPVVAFGTKGYISAPFIQRNPRIDGEWVCRTNWTTLTVGYPPSPLWSKRNTDLIAVFRRPNAMDWWFWVWNDLECHCIGSIQSKVRDKQLNVILAEGNRCLE